MPKWQCHKIVEAFQIVDASAAKDGLTLRGRAGISVTVGTDYVRRLPADGLFRGGYYVRYTDGYESWSPAAAFESGYSRVFAGEDASDDDVRRAFWRDKDIESGAAVILPNTTKSQAIKS